MFSTLELFALLLYYLRAAAVSDLDGIHKQQGGILHWVVASILLEIYWQISWWVVPYNLLQGFRSELSQCLEI